MHELIQKASDYAIEKHGNQKYGGEIAYHKHLEEVYKVLLRFGFTEEKDLDILIASFLHDIIEDTATSYSDVKRIFSMEIAEIVYCMTDEMGRNRKEKKEKTYPKIYSNSKSVILKVADRIANVEFGIANKSPQLEMYRKEFPEFQHHLRIYRQIDDMWEHLQKLLFDTQLCQK